jgi:penicillin-binding protein 1A
MGFLMFLDAIQHHRRLAWALALLASLGAFTIAAVARRAIKSLPPIHTLDTYTPSLITRIYDVRGDVAGELFIERRTLLPLTEIPLDLQRATMAIEDDHFYKHPGIDVKAILRAALANLRAGRARQGASTITQQLAKNIFLTQERTLKRKVKELLLTLQIERNFSKDEILQLYLNQIYYGHGAYGVAAAAKLFFHKKASELTLSECALLAGLPKSPGGFSPFRHPHRAVQRRNTVLGRMRDLGYITEAEDLMAQGEPVLAPAATEEAATAAYFIEDVRRTLEPAYGEKLYKGGLSIHTTMDLRMQLAAETALKKHAEAYDEQYALQRLESLVKDKKLPADVPAKYEAWKKARAKNPESVDEEFGPEPTPVQAAIIAIDPRTGGVRAMSGGRDFQKSQFNRATQAKRQPGSTFKPFVWLAALGSGFTAATVVNDYPVAYTDVTTHPHLVAEATDYALLREAVTGYYTPELLKLKEEKPEEYQDPIWAPQNWDRKFLGPVTLRRGLALSRNLVSVRLIDRVGPRTVADLARRCGIKSPMDPVLSLGLGASVVTMQEMVSAMGTFANDGVHMQSFAVTRVVDKEGTVLEENTPTGAVAVDRQSNYLIVRLMQAVVEEGTGARARALGRPVAGKTGTTQDLRDLWFIGFTPDLVAGVWLGYDDFASMGKKITSAGVTVPFWTDFMQEACKQLPARDFPVPPGIVFAKIDGESGLLALPTTRHVVLEAFKAGLVPTDFAPEESDEDAYLLGNEVTE